MISEQTRTRAVLPHKTDESCLIVCVHTSTSFQWQNHATAAQVQTEILGANLSINWINEHRRAKWLADGMNIDKIGYVFQNGSRSSWRCCAVRAHPCSGVLQSAQTEAFPRAVLEGRQESQSLSQVWRTPAPRQATVTRHLILTAIHASQQLSNLQ